MSFSFHAIASALTRTRKTITPGRLALLRRAVQVFEDRGTISARYPNNPATDPHRQQKEVARYGFIQRFIPARARTLDFGSGSFYGTALLAEESAQVVGVEASRSAVLAARIAWRRIKNLKFI